MNNNTSESKMKVCNTCGKELSLDMYCKAKNSKDGFNHKCKDCEKIRHKKYRDENKEKIKEASKEYYSKNKERESQRKKEFRAAHPERAKELRKAEYERNKEKISERYKRRYYANLEKERERCRKYRERGPEKVRETQKRFKMKDIKAFHEKYATYQQQRRARKRKLPSTLTIEQWQDVKDCFNNECAYCGRRLKLTQDHFVPVDNGGGYTKENIVPACQSCNSSKNNHDFSYWYPTYKYYSKEREQQILKYLSDLKASAK